MVFSSTDRIMPVLWLMLDTTALLLLLKSEMTVVEVSLRE